VVAKRRAILKAALKNLVEKDKCYLNDEILRLDSVLRSGRETPRHSEGGPEESGRKRQVLSERPDS
jgi:hypothetical protein